MSIFDFDVVTGPSLQRRTDLSKTGTETAPATAALTDAGIPAPDKSPTDGIAPTPITG